MPKNEQLFRLIKSLSKAEKRHFKLSLPGNGKSKNYIRLFDAIDKQSIYDEHMLRERFKNETFIKQLHVTKNYLTKLILKSLRSFHATNSNDAKIKDLLRDIEILYRKELFELCAECIQRAEKLAVAFEKNHDLLEIYSWKRKLIRLRATGAEVQSQISGVQVDMRKALENATQLSDYWQLTMDLFSALGANDDTFITHDLLRDESIPGSLQSKILYYYIKQAWWIAKGENKKGEEYADELIALLEAEPQRIREDANAYITALNNRISLALMTSNYSIIQELLKKVRGAVDQYTIDGNAGSAIKLRLHTYNVELEMYRDTGNSRAGIELIPQASALIDAHSPNVPEDYRLMLYYQFAYIYFIDQDFNSALHWLNEFFNYKFGPLREDIQSFAHLLRLIIHFELGNITILKYAVDACRRFLKSKRELHGFEKRLLKFFSKISTAPTSEYNRMLEELKAGLFADDDERVEKNALDYLNFHRWLDQRTLKQGV